MMAGLTLRQAVKKLYEEQGIDISYQYLGKIEKEGCKMDSEQLIKFARLYNVPTDYLMPNKHRPKIELTNIRFFKDSKF